MNNFLIIATITNLLFGASRSGIAKQLPAPDSVYYRLFIQLEGAGEINRILRSGGSGVVRLQEISPRKELSEDTLEVWVQHFGEGMKLDPRAAKADMIISCSPNLLTHLDRDKHVLPHGHDKIFVYDLRERVVMISNEKNPLVEIILNPPHFTIDPVER